MASVLEVDRIGTLDDNVARFLHSGFISGRMISLYLDSSISRLCRVY